MPPPLIHFFQQQRWNGFDNLLQQTCLVELLDLYYVLGNKLFVQGSYFCCCLSIHLSHGVLTQRKAMSIDARTAIPFLFEACIDVLDIPLTCCPRLRVRHPVPKCFDILSTSRKEIT